MRTHKIRTILGLAAILLAVVCFLAADRTEERNKLATPEAAVQATPNAGNPRIREQDLPAHPPMIGTNSQAAINAPVEFLHYDSFDELKPHHLPRLTAEHRAEKSIVGRTRHVLALAYVGDESTVQMFTHTLTNEFRGAHFGPFEESAVSRIHKALGILASRHDSAYSFLLQGVELEFWKTNRHWKSWRDEIVPGDAEAVLVEDCIAGLGISGRPEALEKLYSLRNHPERYIQRQSSAVVDAAFDHDYVSRGDLKTRQIEIVSKSLMSDYRKWGMHGPGKEWKEWSHNALTIELPATK